MYKTNKFLIKLDETTVEPEHLKTCINKGIFGRFIGFSGTGM